MASPKGPVATEAPPFSSSTVSQPSPISADSLQSLQADASRAAATLKRAREGTPTSPSSAIATQLTADYSPSKVAKLAHLASIRSPAPLTGAAALEDERRREEEEYRLRVSGASENPAYKVQAELMSAGALGLSRPQDAPVSLEGLPAVTIPTTTVNDSEPQADTSPTTTSMSGVSGAVTASPAPMDIDPQLERAGYIPQPQAQMEEKENTSLSYPGLVSAATAATQMPAPPPRGSSLPMTPGQQVGARSPSSKKHKCPYCETEFTRHHNLKSHLLTHSQEKPYACNVCQMRFRRLHDLKRHSKLHTGEKPHICPKCDRKFARGDALARHSKGPGGCVSRRGSMFGDDEFGDASHLEGDSSMSGVVYDGSNEGDMTEEDRRRLSLPNPTIKSQHAQGNQAIQEGYATHSRTYPPPPTAPGGRLFPPNVEHGSVNSATPGAAPTPGNAPIFSQTGMTDSPKPLSPGHAQDGNINRQRSPSLATQFQQQQFGRHQTDRQTPPVPGFVASDGRYAAQSGTQGAAEAAQAGATVQSSAPQATSGLGENGDGSTNNLFASDQGIWVYIHNLEESLKELSGRVATLEQTERSQEERVVQLTDEVTMLRAQLEPKSDVMVPEPAIS
ncbi:hypothetical protein BKA67DRAFT_40015 [Truncatella angustata]|uniref:C2H2-type domain-containing protein n=1 Tax=Truncatella angustata TaxID=152316 RepID=A0A9P8UXP8_9PEZI|nr:uncharacterized protein BKA67DRAFT_40015 [Truncatella angustata]KAH6660098.1 hypothetical protein BKA67DRAFT_40015 [Truncatella angustata]